MHRHVRSVQMGPGSYSRGAVFQFRMSLGSVLQALGWCAFAGLVEGALPGWNPIFRRVPELPGGSHRHGSGPLLLSMALGTHSPGAHQHLRHLWLGWRRHHLHHEALLSVGRVMQGPGGPADLCTST